VYLQATTLYCLVTEYCPGGELKTHIKSQENQRLGEKEARVFMRQLISAIHYLHERGVVHRSASSSHPSSSSSSPSSPWLHPPRAL
jgi:serine/threonine protein kinase